VTTREDLEAVARRGDPEEWLRVLLHESTRANNAEGLLAEARDEIARLTVLSRDDDYEFVLERGAILATAVGIARVRLQDGDCAGAEAELDTAAEKTATLLRDTLVKRGATPAQVDLLLGHEPSIGGV
jgi:hypothetical protein